MPLESSLESHSSGYRRPGKKLNPLRAKIAEKKRIEEELRGKRDISSEGSHEGPSKKKLKPNIEDPSSVPQGKGKEKETSTNVSQKEEGEITSRENTPEEIRNREGHQRSHEEKLAQRLKHLEEEMHEASINNKPEIYQKHVREYVNTIEEEYEKAERANDRGAITLYRQKINTLRDDPSYEDYKTWNWNRRMASS